jgi:hypothetical protein
MFVDGALALTRGHYITPRSGRYAGQLGPWARLVRAVGIDPRSALMKWVFVGYGLAWLAIIYAAFFEGDEWSWAAMLVAAVGSLWYLIFGTVTSAIVIVLLLVAGPGPLI